MRHIQRTVFGFFVTLIAVSCNSRLPTNYFDKICDEKVQFAIDTTKKSPTFVSKATDEYLSLRPLCFPSDSFLLRVEYNYNSTLKIFDYIFYKSTASYNIYTFPIQPKSGKILFDKTADQITKFKQTFTIPDRDFANELEKCKIFELPSSFDIKNYPQSPYSKIFTIEYSYKCKYKLLAYSDPYESSENFKEAKMFVKFLNYLKDRFKY